MAHTLEPKSNRVLGHTQEMKSKIARRKVKIKRMVKSNNKK